MTGWLQLTEEQRRAVISEAEQLSGMSAKAVEKDWWVTLALKALFQCAYSKHMVFKGGTSLSKCWNVIARLSEDIDIALAPEAFGMEYIDGPSKTYVEKLKRLGCAFTSTELLQELRTQFTALGLPEGLVDVYAEEVPANRPDTDPQVLYVRYPSLYDPSDYLPDRVKIEVGVRSLRFPYTVKPVQSVLSAVNPKPVYAEEPFPVDVVEPRKTFLEKIFLLHEEFSKPDISRIRTERMSRHLYDLFKMAGTPVAGEALADKELYDHLVKHRQQYSRLPWIDYATLRRETVSFIPAGPVLEEYRRDYQTMQEQMIYEEAAAFDEVVAGLKALEELVRASAQ